MPNFRWVVALAAVCFFAASSFAKPDAKKSNAKESNDEEVEVHVQALQPRLDMSEFEKQGFKVDQPRKSKMVSVEDRDELLAKSGIVKEIETWDHLEKDVFTIRSEKITLAQLVELYPKIPQAKLKKHQQLIAKLRGKK